jgi:hypothetical protein
MKPLQPTSFSHSSVPRIRSICLPQLSAFVVLVTDLKLKLAAMAANDSPIRHLLRFTEGIHHVEYTTSVSQKICRDGNRTFAPAVLASG